MDLANVSDVIAHRRSLNPAEITVAASTLIGASANLRSRVKDLDARIVAEAATQAALPQAERVTPFADLVRWTVAESVWRKLDSRAAGDANAQAFFYQSEIDALTNTGVAVGGSIPVGAFPDLVAYPAY